MGQHGHLPLRRNEGADEVFSIDTPPPTVSGSLHVGHVFSHTHTDTIARYQRMAGSEVFYPMGGTTTACPPNVVSRTTSVFAAPIAALRP